MRYETKTPSQIKMSPVKIINTLRDMFKDSLNGDEGYVDFKFLIKEGQEEALGNKIQNKSNKPFVDFEEDKVLINDAKIESIDNEYKLYSVKVELKNVPEYLKQEAQISGMQLDDSVLQKEIKAYGQFVMAMKAVEKELKNESNIIAYTEEIAKKFERYDKIEKLDSMNGTFRNNF